MPQEGSEIGVASENGQVGEGHHDSPILHRGEAKSLHDARRAEDAPLPHSEERPTEQSQPEIILVDKLLTV